MPVRLCQGSRRQRPALPRSRIVAVLERIQVILEQARARCRALGQHRDGAGPIGSSAGRIVEEEQRGKARAGYGDELIAQLSTRLQAIFGRGFTPSNLHYMRLFYLAYPNLLGPEFRHAVRDDRVRTVDRAGRPARARRKAKGTVRAQPGPPPGHSYRMLTKFESPHARGFYEIETAREPLVEPRTRTSDQQHPVRTTGQEPGQEGADATRSRGHLPGHSVTRRVRDRAGHAAFRRPGSVRDQTSGRGPDG